MAFFDTRRLLALWARYERPASAASLAVGFVFDLIIAKRPDSTYDNLLLLAYLLISAACILVLERRALRPKKSEEAAPEAEPLLLLLVLQFCFGGLASNLLVLYGKSGTVSADALFLGVLACMLIGNEFLRSRYAQLRFNLAVYYTLLLTYLTIAVPTFVLHRIGILAFVLSGAISLAWMAAFLALLSGSARLYRGKQGPGRLKQSAVIVGAVWMAFNALYFSHLIPPVPLSLKAIGIYHSIIHGAAGYQAAFEPAPWWAPWRNTAAAYHAPLGAPAYCFSSIFAPTGLTSSVVHHWEWYDPASKSWINEAKVTFPMTGGRTDGYYGYSIKALTSAGAWRCSVETPSGSLIGQTTFTFAPGMPASTTDGRL